MPHLTEHYAAALSGTAVNASPTAQSQTAVPVCSVRGAPTTPLHAVHWASALLEHTFKTDIAAAHMLLEQLLQQQIQLRQRTSGERGRAALPPAASSHAASSGAPDDVQVALGRLGMAPVAVAAAASGPTRLRLLLRLAVEVLRSQRSTTSVARGQQASQEQQQRGNWRRHYEKHGGSEYRVSPLSPEHLRLVEFAVFLFGVLYQKGATGGPMQGDAATAKDSASREKDANRPHKQRHLLLDPADADALDFVAATAQLLAASLRMESPAKETHTFDCANPPSASVLQQEQAEELLLQGRGSGSWSRQSVAQALQRLLPKAALSEPGKAGLAEGSVDPMAVSLSALAEELVREVAARAAAATMGADLRLIGAPAVPSLSADDAVPLRFLTSAARLRCRAFGLTPLPSPEEAQQLIGSIVPATATATTFAAALACLEVYRLVALGLAGVPSGQRVQQREEPQQQEQRRQQTGRDYPALWLDRGERRYRQAATKQQQQFLRSSFFSLSVPFLAEVPPLPPPMHHFHAGRWRGLPFSPWHFFRLRLRGRGISRSSNWCVGQGAVPGEAEAAEAITISELVGLIEKHTRAHVLSLTCEGTLLYAASEENDKLQRQQLQAALPPHIAALFGEHQQETLPDPETSLTEALRCAGLAPSCGEMQQPRQQQQNRSARRLHQQFKGPTWAVIRIAASDPFGICVPLPPVKVWIRPKA